MMKLTVLTLVLLASVACVGSSGYFTVTMDIIMHNYYELESVKLSMPIPAAIAGTDVEWDKVPHALTAASPGYPSYWNSLKVKLVLDINGKRYESPLYTVMTDRWETHVRVTLRNGVYHVKVLAYRLDPDGKWVLEGQSTAVITVKGSWVPYAVLGAGIVALIIALTALTARLLRR